MIFASHKRHFLILSCAALMLGGCGDFMTAKLVTAGVAATANDVFSVPDVNLREKNYAAADYLSQQMKNNVNRNAVIYASRLEEIDNPGISSPLGVNIPREVGLRLMELGYNVYVHNVPPHGNRNLFPAPPAGTEPNYVLKGTYLRKQGRVEVNLRLHEVKSGKLIAHFDYPLLLSREVRQSVKTPTQIFRKD